MTMDRRTLLRALVGAGAAALGVGRVAAIRTSGAAGGGAAEVLAAGSDLAGGGSGRVHWPAIVPRTHWDPDGTCRPRLAPQLGPGVRRVVVHHTQIFSRYPAEDAADLVHNLCESHVEERGFDDLGYHLIVDRYGVVYEGRAGGLTRPIVGAHAQGFNHGTVGVALMGDFDVDDVPEAARRSLVRVVAWLAELHGFDPAAVSPHVSTGGVSSRHGEGEVVDLPGLFAHRVVGTTSCPGHHLAEYVASGRLLADVEQELASRPR